MDEEIITLDYDDGSSEECRVQGVFELDGKEYIALEPLNDEENIYLYGYEEEGDEYTITEIESDDEFERVSAEYERLMDEEVAE